MPTTFGAPLPLHPSRSRSNQANLGSQRSLDSITRRRRLSRACAGTAPWRKGIAARKTVAMPTTFGAPLPLHPSRSRSNQANLGSQRSLDSITRRRRLSRACAGTAPWRKGIAARKTVAMPTTFGAPLPLHPSRRRSNQVNLGSQRSLDSITRRRRLSRACAGNGAVAQGDRRAENGCYANYLWRTPPPSSLAQPLEPGEPGFSWSLNRDRRSQLGDLSRSEDRLAPATASVRPASYRNSHRPKTQANLLVPEQGQTEPAWGFEPVRRSARASDGKRPPSELSQLTQAEDPS